WQPEFTDKILSRKPGAVQTAATEQKIPGNCYPVDKVIHQDNIEIPAGL
ncbi:DUF1482 family protein, partial [Escherichia coli]|nr:DUF1482 family protein [Escherichia coli]